MQWWQGNPAHSLQPAAPGIHALGKLTFKKLPSRLPIYFLLGAYIRHFNEFCILPSPCVHHDANTFFLLKAFSPRATCWVCISQSCPHKVPTMSGTRQGAAGKAKASVKTPGGPFSSTPGAWKEPSAHKNTPTLFFLALKIPKPSLGLAQLHLCILECCPGRMPRSP